MKTQEALSRPPTKRAATSIDVVLLFADDRGIRHLCWNGLSSYRLSADPGRHPSRVVRDAVIDLGLTPRFIHSASWRFEDGAVVLIYAAVVDPPATRTRAMGDRPVAVGAIAGSAEVLGHTMRHLAWLIREDPAAKVTLERWHPHVQGYQPEPFLEPGVESLA
jgi:hypothetical protein